MELLTDKINAVLASVGTHSTAEERKAVADKLRFLIIAYGKAAAVQAITLEHRVFQSMGLVAVDGEALAKLDVNMALLLQDEGPAFTDTDVSWLNEGAPKPQDYLSVPHPATVDFEGRSFRVPDPDLQALMDDTEALLHPAGANQDIGISWAESLQKVVVRLKAMPLEQEEEDFTRMPMTRYRVHMVVNNILGRTLLREFRREDVTLRAHLKGPDTNLSKSLFAAFEEEFGCSLATNDRHQLLDLTDNEVALYFNRRIEESAAK